MKPIFSALLILILFATSGCFRHWRMSERDIRRHYAKRSVKPTFFTIENDSLKLFCASFGPDTLPPLLLIHGSPGAWYGYLPLLDDSLLQRHFHILAVDRPGYGKSRKGRTTTSITKQAQWVAHALNLNHSGKQAIVLGRSYGAPVAARMTLLYPKRIKHLFLVAAPLDPDKEKFFWFSRWARLPPVQLFLPRRLNLATAEKFTHADELRQLLPLWPNLRVPATVLQGGKDWLVDPVNLDFAKRVLAEKSCEFIFLPDAGHMITNSHPELVRNLILQAAGFKNFANSETGSE